MCAYLSAKPQNEIPWVYINIDMMFADNFSISADTLRMFADISLICADMSRLCTDSSQLPTNLAQVSTKIVLFFVFVGISLTKTIFVSLQKQRQSQCCSLTSFSFRNLPPWASFTYGTHSIQQPKTNGSTANVLQKLNSPGS